MVAHAAPLAEQLWAEHYSPAAMAERVAREARRAAAVVGDMPFTIDAVLRKARAGRVEIQFVHRNLEHFVREMDRSSNRLSFAVVIAALIVGSTTVLRAGVGVASYVYPVLGLAGFCLAGVLGIGLVIGVMRSGRL
jgi:ubiquinone biosynthesis protein